MRPYAVARAIACAVLFTPMFAAIAGHAPVPVRKSLADCTAFDQTNKDDVTVSLSIKNSCTVPIDCSVSWRVVCAPGSKRRAVHNESSKLSMPEHGEKSTDASAAVCGDDPWTLDSIQWSCEPNKE